MADQLTSDELRQVLAEWLRPMRPKHRQKILGLAGLFEAVIARAETAEAEARDARNNLDDAELHLRRAEAAATALAARVAELEAASELAIDKWADAARSETQLRLDAAEARVAELEAQLPRK
jgi:phage-related minor tail protein